VADNQQFETLRKQVEAMSRDFRQCRDPIERRDLLRRMRLALDEVDQLILDEPSHADSNRDSTVRPHTFLLFRL
jgi:hypothetical protein